MLGSTSRRSPSLDNGRRTLAIETFGVGVRGAGETGWLRESPFAVDVVEVVVSIAAVVVLGCLKYNATVKVIVPSIGVQLDTEIDRQANSPTGASLACQELPLVAPDRQG